MITISTIDLSTNGYDDLLYLLKLTLEGPNPKARLLRGKSTSINWVTCFPPCLYILVSALSSRKHGPQFDAQKKENKRIAVFRVGTFQI